MKICNCISRIIVDIKPLNRNHAAAYGLMKKTYLCMFLTKVCFYKSILYTCITNDQSKHRHFITTFSSVLFFNHHYSQITYERDCFFFENRQEACYISFYKNGSACRLPTNTPAPSKSVTVHTIILSWVHVLICLQKRGPKSSHWMKVHFPSIG